MNAVVYPPIFKPQPARQLKTCFKFAAGNDYIVISEPDLLRWILVLDWKQKYPD